MPIYYLNVLTDTYKEKGKSIGMLIVAILASWTGAKSLLLLA